MLRTIILHEWRQWRRDKRLAWLIVALLLLGAVALILQANYYRNLLNERSNAQQRSRQAWLTQGNKHPHMAAHFGNYAFKRPSALYCFDAGLTAYTGSSVYLEPHRQNDFLLSQVQDSDTGARFGWMAPSLVCQLLAPLFIILLTFGCVNGEQTRGTYRLLLAQGVTVRQLLFGKATAVWLLFAVFISVYLLATVVLARLLFAEPLGGLTATLAYLWLVYAVYYAVWCLLGVAVSAVTKTGSAIAILLSAWVLSCIILPKAAANIADNLHPLSSNYLFKKQVSEAIDNGLNGHDAKSARAKRLEDSLLRVFEVDSVQQLPFNFEGFIMQQGEAYSSQVYDYHFTKIFTALQQQHNTQAWFSIGSPFIAVSHLSMAACNGSMETEIDFQQQAEHYRRDFVQFLNEDMMHHSAYGDWDNYKVMQQQYRAITDFTATTRGLGWRLGFVRKEHILLLLWLVVAVGVVLYISSKRHTVS